MRRLLLPAALIVLLAGSAAAQQRPIFDPDDFVDPRQRGAGTLFVSRLVAGGAWNFIDDYRPVGQDVGFLHLMNSFYWKTFELDYKHSEVRPMDGAPDVRVCGCSPPIYFPTPPPGNAIPAAPHPQRKDMLQAGWYWSKGGGSGQPRIMLRSRLSVSYQTIDTPIRSGQTDEVVERLSGHELSIGLDTDTHFRVRGRDVFGSLLFARTVQEGTIADRSQNEWGYMSRFPGMAAGPVLLRSTLMVGGVSGRGANGINVVSPSFEALWHEPKSEVNFHVVWNPMALRDGADGWRTRHQVAVFVDYGYVKLFERGR